MERMTDRELVIIIQAKLQGHEIQQQYLVGDEPWMMFTGTWNQKSYRYRVKPEPREFWILLDHNGDHVETFEDDPDIDGHVIKVSEDME